MSRICCTNPVCLLSIYKSENSGKTAEAVSERLGRFVLFFLQTLPPVAGSSCIYGGLGPQHWVYLLKFVSKKGSCPDTFL